MARPTRKKSLVLPRYRESALKLIALGAAFALLPLFLGTSLFGKAFAPLMPLGLILVAAGALLLWLGQEEGRTDGRPVSA